jgi:hypothetical protein
MTTAYEHKTQLVGDDYTGLPTQPVKYRGRRHGSSVDWDQIQADYIARGGQVDASVWPQHGKVVVVTGNARTSRANLHTFIEAQDDDYAEPETVRKPRGRQRDFNRAPHRPKSKLTDAQRDEIGRRYSAGATVTELGPAYGVSTTTITKVLAALGIPTRNQLARERNAS